ncbi:hypothetical protein ACA910_019354 [Epithemia clementina (nom. ined.)]
MGRTSDQAKLLFFGLLRTVSALASTDHKVAPLGSQALAAVSAYTHHRNSNQHHHHHHQSPPSLPELTLRLAHRTDVPSIQRCNLATLPENYNQQFYTNHLRQWPELAIVVECATENNHYGDLSSEGTEQQRLILKPDSHYSFSPFPTNGRPESQIVAYVIGKVEEHVLEDEESWRDRQDCWGQSHGFLSPPTFRTEKLGHVTSLAVLEPYRRRGLAHALMEQLHHHMVSYYGVKSVGLHVRQSNLPAERLYRAFGYHAAERIPSYYQDGEDAYMMKKILEPQVDSSSSSSSYNSHNNLSFFGNLRRLKGRDIVSSQFRLPRSVGQPLDGAATNEEEESNASALLTGTM